MTMEEIAMNRNQLATWMTNTMGKHAKSYQFDFFSGIARIMRERHEHQDDGKEHKETYRWYLGKYGTWMVNNKEDNKGEELMKENSDICYLLIIDWSCDYTGNPFAMVSAICINH